jgi:hypothetical protein
MRHVKITNPARLPAARTGQRLGQPMKTIVACLCVCLLQISVAGAADDAAVRRCRGIVDASARLACYDALPLGGETSATGQPAAPASAALANTAASAQGGAPAQKAPAATAADPQQQFGLQPKVFKQPVESIESSIPGHFEGWGPRTKITLANGQVWRIDDGSSLSLDFDNPKVVIRRGAFGSYLMDIANDNRSPRVVRVQ